MIEKTCLQCGAPFRAKESRKLTAKYCSRRCSGLARWPVLRDLMRRKDALQSDEVKQKISASLRRWYKTKDGIALRERKRKIMAESARTYWADPEKRKLMSIKTREVRRHFREGFKGHQDAISQTVSELVQQGFRCIPLDKKPRPDIIAFKGNKIFAVEVEFDQPAYSKYDGCNLYDDIIWVLKRR